jgi:hypothetical protein
MARSRARREGGFVITLELVLIFTILGIGLLVGIVAVRNALFVYWQKKKAQTVWVYDSADPVHILGPARDFDEHEAPRLFYVDRDVPWGDPPVERNFRAFVGVRDDRFTSRHRIFYEGPGCTGPAICIQGAGSEMPDSRHVGEVVEELTPGEPMPTDEWVDHAGGVGYLYALQEGPSYAIGRDPDTAGNPGGLPGALYRQSAELCDADTTQSVWESQRVGSACVERTVTLVVSDLNCPPSASGCSGGADPQCSDTGSSCDCPAGWFRPTGGSNCCPDGSVEGAPGQCRNGSLFEAELVDLFYDAGFTPPFKVNLPPDPDSFELLAPGGGEGEPGIPTGVPYEGSSIDFDNPSPTPDEGTP